VSLAFLLFALLAWWAQRDAYRMGTEHGRLLERRVALERLQPPGRHLRLVHGSREE
jgi:hypothetical protein